MGHKSVCLHCRKAFSQGTDLLKVTSITCPECNELMVYVDQKFKPPKNSALKKWETVAFLIDNGFFYQSVYNENSNAIPYPIKMKDAKVFVDTYLNQALLKK